MINDESIRKLMELNLSEMVEVIQRQEHDVAYTCMPFDERIQYITDYVYQVKQEAISSGWSGRRSSDIRTPSSIQCTTRSGTSAGGCLMELGTCAFIECNHNVVFNGFKGAENPGWLARSASLQERLQGQVLQDADTPRGFLPSGSTDRWAAQAGPEVAA